MKELKVKTTYKKKGIMDDVKVRAFIPEPGDRFPVDDKQGVDKDVFFSILDKASQPVKSEAKSDSEQSQT